MPISISAEWDFFALDHVKTKLINNINVERMQNLVILTSYLSIAQSINLVSLCDKVVAINNCTGKRDKLF